MLTEMEFKGSASLHNNNIDVIKNVSGNLDLRIDRVNANIGRVYVVDQNGNAQPMPGNITMLDKAGGAVLAHNNEFLYIYADSYSVLVNNQVIVRLDQQKQHSLMAPKHIVHEKIEM
jgi:hypothetical protein